MKSFIENIVAYFQSDTKRYSTAYKWLFITILIFTVYYLFAIIILPLRNYKFIIPDEKITGPRGFNHEFKSYYSVDNSLSDKSIELAREEAFLLARLEMAKSDTIALALDLKDSTISLIVQGVTIHTSNISGFKVSKIFYKSDPILIAKFYSWPFKILEYSSSVPKVPVIVRKAPRDTIEAASLPEPGQLKENHQFVSFQLRLDRKLNLIIEQDSISDTITKKSVRYYLYQQKKTKRKLIRNALIRDGPYEYIPEIRIMLDRSDALVFFRATPQNADIAIRYIPH